CRSSSVESARRRRRRCKANAPRSAPPANAPRRRGGIAARDRRPHLLTDLPGSPAMATPVRIDFVSDVSCPWCPVGLKSLQQAIDRVGDAVDVELHFQPCELNPRMPPEGEDRSEERRAAENGAERQVG